MGMTVTRSALLAMVALFAMAGCTREASSGAPAPAKDNATPADTSKQPPASRDTAAAAPAIAEARDADALAALEKMGAALRAMDRFGLRAETSTDYVTDTGQKVAVDGHASYQVRMPDRLVATVANDRQEREFYYDGKSLALWSPKLKYYTVIDDVPPTIGELVTQASAKGIEFPLADLFLWGTPQAPLESITSAFLVGPVLVEGDETDHYAFRQPGVDWQVWISRKTSLPAKVSITSLADPAQPSYSARLHWDRTPASGEGAFSFKPPADARRIEFVPVKAGTAAEAH
ncbi:MAG TPA: DUF2092 domain-containing protein [Stenotrophomonas sp.]